MQAKCHLRRDIAPLLDTRYEHRVMTLACSFLSAHGYAQRWMDTGYRIVRGGSVHSPQGTKARWWMRPHKGFEAIWGNAGDSGWRLAGNSFFDPRGAQTSYFVVANGDLREIHGPEEQLPWE